MRSYQLWPLGLVFVEFPILLRTDLFNDRQPDHFLVKVVFGDAGVSCGEIIMHIIAFAICCRVAVSSLNCPRCTFRLVVVDLLITGEGSDPTIHKLQHR